MTPAKSYDLKKLDGQTIRIYRNLHRDCFSIMLNRKVILHIGAIVVTDAKFLVSQAGRARAKRDGRKNVHAFVEGRFNYNLYTCLNFINPKSGREVSYTPFTKGRTGYFRYKDNNLVCLEAEMAIGYERSIYLPPPRLMRSGPEVVNASQDY